MLYLNHTRVFFFSDFLLYLQMKKLYLTNKKVVERNFHIYGCVRLGNLDLDFENPDFGSAIEREIRKRISTLRYLFLDFHFYRSIGKSKKGFEKLSLRIAVFHAHAYLAKRRPLFTRIVLQILFRISQSNGKKEIHEIRIWIS